jgi:hypothetical protein
MTRNPFYNAVLAAGYITLVASIMYFGPRLASGVDSVMVPIAMLSLFVLSAATMGYLFFFEPAQLYLAGERREATVLFLKTIGAFAGITATFLIVLFLLAAG